MYRYTFMRNIWRTDLFRSARRLLGLIVEIVLSFNYGIVLWEWLKVSGERMPNPILAIPAILSFPSLWLYNSIIFSNQSFNMKEVEHLGALPKVAIGLAKHFSYLSPCKWLDRRKERAFWGNSCLLLAISRERDWRCCNANRHTNTQVDTCKSRKTFL